MTETASPIRQRLVLVVPVDQPAAELARSLDLGLRGGDVASVIIVQGKAEETAFIKAAELLVPIAQGKGAAAIIAGDSRAAGRAGADGIHLPAEPRMVRDAVQKANGKTIVGADAGKTRDQALDVGEEQPDYVFIGKLDGDTHPVPHPRNIELASWWADVVEVPAIIMAGSTVQSVAEAAATGVEFIALSQAVLKAADPLAAVDQANAILDARFAARAAA
ncbi:MAG: thiamine phosphate synthase [Rhizobiaceae bacterium]|jgi:thiamine-phosphate pyrophosphorylase|nr:thiamine phosphate synthase [Rhizobiaceae bacterium]